jgi:hypothetical protein
MIITDIKDITALPSPALGLLPAVHDASVQVYTSGNLPTVAAGQVLLNNSSGAMTLPAYGAWPPQKLALGSYAACDGRFWFPARRYKVTNSYYPEVFERTMYSLPFTPESLSLGTPFTLARKISLRMLNNNTDAVWNVVWEIGMRTSQVSPAPIGPNLDAYVWREPLIDQQVHLTDVMSSHEFSVRLTRKLTNSVEEWLGDVRRYDKTLGASASQLPTSNYFVLRLRLSCFDTLNDVSDPRGYVAYYCSELK